MLAISASSVIAAAISACAIQRSVSCQQQARDAGDQVRAVDGGEPVACLQPGHGDAGPVESDLAREPLSLVETLPLAHQAERDLAHRCEISAGADAALLAHHGGDSAVQHGDVGQWDLGAASGVAPRVHVDAAQHGSTHVLDRRGCTDPGRMVVDEVTLEVLDLFVCEHDFGELSDPGVHSVHDLVGCDLLLEHAAAPADAIDGLGRQLHRLAAARHAHDIFDLQTAAIDSDRHVGLLLDGVLRSSGPGALRNLQRRGTSWYAHAPGRKGEDSGPSRPQAAGGASRCDGP